MTDEIPLAFRVISASCFAFSGLVMLFIIVIESFIFNRQKETTARLFNVVSMFTFILYLSQIILASLDFFMISGTLYCDYIVTIILGMHFVGRGIYSSLYLLRIHMVFKSTIYQYSPKVLLSLFFIIFISSISMASLYVYDHLTNAYYDPQKNVCVLLTPIYITTITAIWDCCGNAILVYLFVRKLRAVVFACADATNDNRVELVITKNTVLVLMSITSSMFIGLFHISVLLPIGIEIVALDFVINAVCIMFMKNYYAKPYQIVCYYPSKCVNECCLRKFNQNIENLKHMKEINRSPESVYSKSKSSTVAVTTTMQLDATKSVDETITN